MIRTNVPGDVHADSALPGAPLRALTVAATQANAVTEHSQGVAA